MLAFIVDENLPYYFSIWNDKKFIHVIDLEISFSDSEIWEYAKQKNLTIITKDADFSNKVLFETPPPKVIHLKIGNMKLKDLYNFLKKNWQEIEIVSKSNSLTNVYLDRIEGID